MLKILIELGKKLLTGSPKKVPPKVPKKPTKPPKKCTKNCDDNNPYKKRTREQNEQAAESEKRLIKEHEDKLRDYQRDPYSMDNKGLLKNAPNDSVRESIIRGRTKVLQDAITRHQNELRKIQEALRNQ